MTPCLAFCHLLRSYFLEYCPAKWPIVGQAWYAYPMEHFSPGEGGGELNRDRDRDTTREMPEIPELGIIPVTPEIVPDIDKIPPQEREKVIGQINDEEREEEERRRRIEDGVYDDPRDKAPEAPPTIH